MIRTFSKILVIIIAIIIGGIILGGIFVWQYLSARKEEVKVSKANAPIETTLKENKTLKEKIDNMLAQMFPGVEIKTAGHFGVEVDEIVEGNFLKPGKKSYLLIARVSAGNPEGYDHAYLGIFDENGKLQTSIISKTEVPISHGISLDPPYFGGDRVQFEFYDCQDTTYIFVNVAECLTGGVTTCEDRNNLLLKVVDNKFTIVQDFLKELQPENTLTYPTKESIRLYRYVDKNELPENFQCINKRECLGEAFGENGEFLFLIFSKEIPFDFSIYKFK